MEPVPPIEPRWGRLKFAFAVGVAATSALLLFCGDTALVASGGECLFATDCAEGLVCIPKGDKRICSSDLTSVQKPVSPMGDGGPAQVNDGAVNDGAVTSADTGVVVPPTDSGTVVPPVDAGDGG